jgi:hypothetical protein
MSNMDAEEMRVSRCMGSLIPGTHDGDIGLRNTRRRRWCQSLSRRIDVGDLFLAFLDVPDWCVH